MKRKGASAYLVALFALAVIIILIARLSPDEGTIPEIILPTAAVSSPGGGKETDWSDGERRAEVTPETVQAVIATLNSALSYSRVVTMRTLWPGGEGVSTIEVKAKNNMLRLTETVGDERRNILILGEQLYIWYDGDDALFTGKAARDEADRLQRMISVRRILELSPSSILDASYTELNGESCIYVEYSGGELGYTETAYISASTGLLMGADTYAGETLLIELRSGEPDETTLADGEFELPRQLQEQQSA